MSQTPLILDCRNRQEFRQWLEANHQTVSEAWLALKRGVPKDDDQFWYLDAVEEALCFGWIDSVLKKMDGQTLQRFTPRRPKSNWTELNKERCRRLEALGLMTDSGRRVLPDMSIELVIDDDLLKLLMSDAGAWTNFQNFPPLYQRVRIDNIQSQKKGSSVYQARAQKLLDNNKLNKMYGEWNDRGRLGWDYSKERIEND